MPPAPEEVTEGPVEGVEEEPAVPLTEAEQRALDIQTQKDEVKVNVTFDFFLT